MSDNFPTFRRFGRWWWRGTCRFVRRLPLILLVLLVVLGTPWTILNIKYGRELERELAALKAAGKPLTLVEATARVVPDSENAAPIYQEVFGVQWLPDGGTKTTPGLGGVTQEQMSAIAESLRREDDPVPAEVRRVHERQMMEANLDFLHDSTTVGRLREASLRSHAVFPVNWQDGPGALFPHLAKFRESARLVAFSAEMEAITGQGDEALERLGIVVRMAGHASEDPTLINQLVGYAMDAIVFDAARLYMDAAPPSPEAMQRLYETLRQREYRTALVRSMETERAMGLDIFHWQPWRFAEGILLESADDGRKAFAKVYASPIASPCRKLDELHYVRTMAQSIQRVERPYRESGPGTDEPTTPPPAYLISRVLLPAFGRASQKCDWAMAQNGLLQTALALKAYRREHGSYPETLTGLPWAIPDDPFSGKPFVYRRQGAGFRLYSLGPDLEDNQGQPIQTGARRTEPAKSSSGWDGDIVWVSRT